MSNSNRNIIEIYNSRNNILEILEERGFNIKNYEKFSINEISILLETDQLDMLLENNDKKKIYVKYYINKVIKSQNIYDIVEDLFTLENILTKQDDLIIIIKDEPNDTLLQVIKDIWQTDKNYVALVNIKRLQFNIIKHVSVPKHRVLNQEESDIVKKRYNIKNDNEFPDISYFSPVSIVLGIRPGDIVHILRNSKTSISTDFYRLCKLY